MSGPGIALVAVVMAVGLAGTVVPFMPGLAVIWAAALVYGIVDGFTTAGAILFGLITLLALTGTAAKFVLPGRGGAGRGAPTSTLAVGLVFGVVGFFVVPVIGLPLGAVLGVLVAEYQRTQDWQGAWHRTKGVLIGFGVGALAEFTAAFCAVVVWVVWVLVG